MNSVELARHNLREPLPNKHLLLGAPPAAAAVALRRRKEEDEAQTVTSAHCAQLQRCRNSVAATPHMCPCKLFPVGSDRKGLTRAPCRTVPVCHSPVCPQPKGNL